MNISKTTVFIGFSTGVKLLGGLIINKYISITAGPSGLVIIGQLQNFLSIINMIGSGGIEKGITTSIAAGEQRDEDIAKIIRTSFFISSIFCLLIFAICSNPSYISKFIFNNESYSYLIVLAAFSVLFFTFNNFSFAVINGFKDVKKYTKLNIYSSISALVLTCGLVYLMEIEGALLALILNQFFVTTILFFSLKNEAWIKEILNLFSWDIVVAKKLMSYSFMTLIGVVSLPIALLIIRNFLIEKEGIIYAGNWEAIWKISQYYLMVLTTGFGVYLLPTYSSISDKSKLREEVFKSFKFVFLLASSLAIIIFVLREFVVLILFDDSFLEVAKFMKYQLIGDVIKVCSWSVGILLQAKAKTVLFIITQLIFNSLFVLLLLFLHQYFGTQTVFLAYMINYMCHILFIFFICRKILW